MKKKGFTLIELLAVIVILSVISIITVPMILGVVEDARKSAFKATCNEIYDAYEEYEIQEEVIGGTNIYTIFDFSSEREATEVIDGIKYEPISKLSLKGELPKSGTYEIKDGKRELIIDNGKYTCVRNENREEILDGVVADNDLTAPIVRSVVLSSTTKSIKVIVDGYEEDGIITKYYYQLNNEEVITSEVSVHVFEGLNTQEEYEIKVYVENKSGLKSEVVSKTIETKEINGTTYVMSQSPEGTEYATSKVVKVTYDNQEGLNYYLKADVEVEVVSGIIEKCGNDTEPGSCTSTNVTTLEANKWYRTKESTTSVIFRENGNLYTLVSDGKNTADMSTYNVSKIDPSVPSVSMTISDQKTDRVTLTAICSDEESGITKYEYSDGSKWYDGSLNNSYTITGLEDEKDYEFKVRCTNGAGQINEASSNNNTLGITNPSISYENTPSTAVNGYLTSQTLKVTFSNTNIANPEYFIKTTRVGVSSLAVTSTCGSGDEPGSCTSITSTTTLEANTWYKVSGNVNVTYNEYATSTGTLYAITYDGTNYSGAATGTISKITKEVTYTVKHYQMDTDMTNYTLYETETLTATANYETTPSVKTYTGFTSPSTQTVTVEEDGSTVVEYKYIRKQVLVTFYRNTSTSDTTTNQQTFTYGKGNEYFSSKGWTKSGYTIGGWRETNSGAYKYKLTSGVSSNWINTNSPSINLYAVWLKNPTFTQTSETITSGYTWATSRTIQITYTNTNMTSPVYYFKTNVTATVSSGTVTAVCGTSTNPETCTSTSVTTLVAGTWYQTTSTTPSVTFSSTGTLTATMTDGSSGVYASSTYQVTNVSDGTPSAPVITGGNTSWSNRAKTISVSTESTATSGISHYQYYISTSSSTQTGGSWTSLSSGTTSVSISTNGTRYIYFRAVGNNGKTGTISTAQTTVIDTYDPSVSVEVDNKTAKFTISDNIGVTGYGVNQSTESEPTYTGITSTTSTTIDWTATEAGEYVVWVKDASGRTGEASFTIESTSFCAYETGYVWTFDYSGGSEEFIVPCDGTYKLEVYGAQGGKTDNTVGGKGGYSYGNKVLTIGNNLYIAVGGQGGTSTKRWNESQSLYSVTGGYNGGGKGGTMFTNNYYQSLAGGGGGATHIAIGSTNRGVLANYADYKSELLIVAGGGSGGYTFISSNTPTSTTGATGGGTSGGTGEVAGGTQTTGYAFGQGQDGYQTFTSYRTNGSGAGGGYYGGYSNQAINSTVGGGGSGYIDGVTDGVTESGIREGNGYAQITLVSISS